MFLKLFTLLLAFGIGSIPFGLILCTLFAGVDPREEGSANIGATNVARLAGWGLGGATLALDAAKGLFVILLARSIFGSGVWVEVCGFLAISGHCWSVFLDFRGGKGVATTAGVFLGLAPLVLLLNLGIWAGTYWWSRRASVASLAAAVALPVLCALLAVEHLLISLLVLGVLVVRHRSNLERILDGSEPVLGED